VFYLSACSDIYFAINAQASLRMPAVTTPGDYSYLDPENLIPKNLLNQALNYFDQLKNRINNKNYLVVIDYKQHNSKERFFVIDMISGHVEKYLTAHGKNSDPDFDGFATSFSNEPNSLMTSLGLFLTAETYFGNHGLSLMLDGLSSTNFNARTRNIVIHGAIYVTPGEKIGRSFGCPALEFRYTEEVINKIKGGALIFAGY
jgi:hypothetical protein